MVGVTVLLSDFAQDFEALLTGRSTTVVVVVVDAVAVVVVVVVIGVGLGHVGLGFGGFPSTLSVQAGEQTKSVWGSTPR